jgi:hypothetical protein
VPVLLAGPIEHQLGADLRQHLRVAALLAGEDQRGSPGMSCCSAKTSTDRISSVGQHLPQRRSSQGPTLRPPLRGGELSIRRPHPPKEGRDATREA